MAWFRGNEVAVCQMLVMWCAIMFASLDVYQMDVDVKTIVTVLVAVMCWMLLKTDNLQQRVNLVNAHASVTSKNLTATTDELIKIKLKVKNMQTTPTTL